MTSLCMMQWIFWHVIKTCVFSAILHQTLFAFCIRHTFLSTITHHVFTTGANESEYYVTVIRPITKYIVTEKYYVIEICNVKEKHKFR